MANSHGYRSTTRKKFTKPFRRNGSIRMKNYLQTFKLGEYVDIVVDSAIHKGMPHHSYHGRTGKVFNINPRSLGVIIKKQVRNRLMEKRLHIRVEHLRKSNVRSNLVKRIQENDKLKAQAKKEGKVISTKRLPVSPADSKVVKLEDSNIKVHAFDPYIELH